MTARWASNTCATFRTTRRRIPTILTTSQKLSTGVDARNIRNIVLMRPINSMIEFKQIIGRGTRLYDGKDYFTIYDFVNAHHHFNDPEWDGEPIEPEPKPPPSTGGGGTPNHQEPAVRRSTTATPEEDQSQTRRRQSPHHPAHDGDDLLAPRRHADVRAAIHGDAIRQAARVLQRRSRTARPVERPDTRAKLLQGLAEKGFGSDQLAEMQKIIDAEKSDLFDVLAHVAYALPTAHPRGAGHLGQGCRSARFSTPSSRRFSTLCSRNT